VRRRNPTAKRVTPARLALTAIGLLAVAQAAEPGPLPEMAACLRALGPAYTLHGAIEPAFLLGDFDGDGKGDVAAAVRKDEARGLAVCRSDGSAPLVLGAGREYHEMVDLTFDAWSMHPKERPVEQGADEGPPPRLRGDAILLVWSEKSSALILWNGTDLVWYQQGD
jgi:hypothetical protein